MMDPVLSPNAWLRYDAIRRVLERLLPLESILELGAGQGSVGARLSRLARYTGVEPDPISREVARGRLPRSAVMVQDLGELDPAADFDLACAFEVLEHIEDDLGTLRAWTERVRPGGHLLLSVPAHAKRFAAADHVAGHFRRYDPPQLRALARKVGLIGVETQVYGFPLGYVLEMGRNLAARRSSRREMTVAERTSGSGRLMQPPPWAAALTWASTAPFRWSQRPFGSTQLGTGLILLAQRPPRSGP